MTSSKVFVIVRFYNLHIHIFLCIKSVFYSIFKSYLRISDYHFFITSITSLKTETSTVAISGFVGLCIVLGALLALVIKTFATGARSEDLLGSYICTGIGGALMAQIAVNVGMNLRVLPVIGVTLPFYSAGGSSVLMLYICVGLVLSVYMHNTKKLFG